MRVFAGWRLPERLRGEIEAVREELQRELPRASWPRASGLHLTLAFFGETAEKDAERLGEAMIREFSGIPPVRLAIGPAGFFPSKRKPRVGWLAIDGGEELSEIASIVRGAADTEQIHYDTKPFRPHVTIARPKERFQAEDVERFCDAFNPLLGAAATLDHVSLLRSVQDRGGVRYEELVRAEL